MTPQEFVIRLRAAVVEESSEIYRNIFVSTKIEKASNPYWKQALGLFDSLTSSQKEVFFEILRQIVVDTTSNVLGVIDGVGAIEGVEAKFELIYDGTQKLNGDLQSLFLVEEEKTKN